MMNCNVSFPWRPGPRQLLLYAMLMFCFLGCKNDDPAEINPQDAIVATWTLDKSGTLTKDGTDILSDDYIGLTITFSANKTYTTQNPSNLFKTSGTWQWSGTGTQSLVLDGDFAISVSKLTTTDLVLHFVLSTTGSNGGRENSVAGEYVLGLKAKTN